MPKSNTSLTLSRKKSNGSKCGSSVRSNGSKRSASKKSGSKRSGSKGSTSKKLCKPKNQKRIISRDKIPAVHIERKGQLSGQKFQSMDANVIRRATEGKRTVLAKKQQWKQHQQHLERKYKDHLDKTAESPAREQECLYLGRETITGTRHYKMRRNESPAKKNVRNYKLQTKIPPEAIRLSPAASRSMLSSNSLVRKKSSGKRDKLSWKKENEFATYQRESQMSESKKSKSNKPNN